MARLVSYKLNCDSTYSTFNNEQSLSSNDISNESNSCWWKCCGCCCCRYSSNTNLSDETDIEFALIKYSQV